MTSKMDFPDPQQPDEGYSEDPLYPSAPSAQNLAALSSFRTSDEVQSWIIRHLATLPVAARTQITMALLNDLPTAVVAQIVHGLNPRLYIDFVKYLPPEVCLKILGYLDPISLINVGRTCKPWYHLALDQKLWRRLYVMEGWKVIQSEIDAREARVRKEIGVTIFDPWRAQPTECDGDTVMSEADKVAPEPVASVGAGASAGTSIFGRPSAALQPRSSSDMDVDGVGHKNKGPDPADIKGKGKMAAAQDGARLPSAPTAPAVPTASTASTAPAAFTNPDANILRSSLWTWDSSTYRVNWKYLYNMRMRLESNWELGKYTNFQFPHPDYPYEGHQECIYGLQFDSQYLVSGSRDRTLRIWNLHTRRLIGKPLYGHTGSVLCLQFDASPDEDIIVSGSSDSNVIVWKFSTGEIIQRLDRAHSESVLNVRFDKRILVTCSKDKTIKVFNRHPLRYGDLGYNIQPQVVDPVAIRLKKYGMELDLAKELPVVEPWTMISQLCGHTAAVNAVQIHGRLVVSASGDRYIKIWDWPEAITVRQISEHVKGIACVQFDGRRIVSGSSDNLVKIFDADTGVEVASLRNHSNLVRTVQSGFGDLPYSVYEDEAEARRIDQQYFMAVEQGLVEVGDSRSRNRHRNAGSSRPEEITSFGAKIPPGGGGGRYGRIVSGSYDQNIIIWRRDKEGAWKAAHHLRQEAGAAAARAQHARPAPPRPQPPSHPNSQAPAPGAAGLMAPLASPPLRSSFDFQVPMAGHDGVSGPSDAARATATESTPFNARAIIDSVVPLGVAELQRALANYPGLLASHSHILAAIDRESSPLLRSQLRQALSAALMRVQVAQNGGGRQLGQVHSSSAAAAAAAAAAGPSTPTPRPRTQGRPVIANGAAAVQDHMGAAGPSMAHLHAAAAAANQDQAAHLPQNMPPQQAQQLPPPPVPHHIHPAAVAGHHPHMPAVSDGNNPARVFKLQFDARRIICCSQNTTIVGWDFCNGDVELEEAAAFFAPID